MRYRSIDLMRTTAIVIMVAVHFIENLAGVVPPIAGLGAPMFVFLSGVSYRLWLDDQRARGTAEAEIAKRTVRRGLFLFGAGIAFNVLVWLPEDAFNWDVLTLIGSGFFAMELARRMPTTAVLGLCATVLAITPVAQVMADYEAYWQVPWFDYDINLPDVVLGYLVNGYFPLLPWIAYPLIGFVSAGWLFTDPLRTQQMASRTAWLGGALLLVALGAVLLGPGARATPVLRGWRMNPPSLEYVVGTIGLVLLYLGVALRVCDRAPERSSSAGWWLVPYTFSRYSFTIYVLHHLAHVWPLWLYGLSQGEAVDHYWRDALPLPVALALGGVFLVPSYFFLRWLDRRRAYSIEGVMRWVCD